MPAPRHVLRLLALLLTAVLGTSVLSALPAQAARTASISGVVKDQAGQPLAGAYVSVQHPGRIGEPTVVTDANGAYTVGNLEAGTSYHVSASKSFDDPATRLRESYTQVYYPQKADVADATLFTLTENQAQQNINFTLTKRGRIAFQVTGSHGRPSHFVSLVVRQSTDGGRTWTDRNEGQNTTARTGWVQITPEPGHLYKFRFVPPGRSFVENSLKEKYDPVVAEWWNDASSEASAAPIGTTTEGQYVSGAVRLSPPPAVPKTPIKVAGAKAPKVGKKLTASTSAWKSSRYKLTYKWYRNGKAIKGQTKRTYKLRNADQGKRISVRVTGKKAGLKTTSVLSKKTAKVKKR